MMRKMAYIGSGYFLGLIFASFFHLNTIAFTIIFVIALFSMIIFNGKRKEILALIISAVTGITVFSVYDLNVYSRIKSHTGDTIELTGIVTDISEMSKTNNYTVKTKIDGNPVYISLYANNLNCDYYDRISFTGKLKDFQNDYLFPEKDYNEAKNIMFSTSSPDNVSVEHRFSILRYVLNYRDYICGKISEFLPLEEGEFLKAMLCGDKSGIDSDLKLMVYRSGIGHIMSVSGTHLSIMAAIILFIADKFKLNRKLSYGILAVFVGLFAVFSGLSMSVLRSAVMILIVYSAPLFKRQYDVFSSLGIAVILLTIFQPYAIRDVSFLLSVSGTFGIGVLAPYVCSHIEYQGRGAKTLKSILAFLCANIAVIPASVLYFDEFSIISPITNLVLVPVCMISLVLGFIVALTGGINIIAFPLLLISGLLCKLVLTATDFLGRLDFTYISSDEKYITILILIAFCAVMTVLKLWGKKKAVLSLVLSSALIITSIVTKNNIANDFLTIGFFTNHGHSCMIIVNDKNALLVNNEADYKTLAMARKFLLQNHVNNIQFSEEVYDYRSGLYKKYFGAFDNDKVNYPYIAEETRRGLSINYSQYDLLLNSSDDKFTVRDNKNIPRHYNGNTVIKFTENGELLVRSI